MTEKQIVAAFAAYERAFGRIGLTLVGMDEKQREAAASACLAAVERGSALTKPERAALEPERPENTYF